MTEVDPHPDLVRRLDLQSRLEDVTGLPEAQVHFQPPTGANLTYPCVIYARSRSVERSADNLPYLSAMGYTVTVIHEDPDNEIRAKIAAMPYCKFDRWYASDGLNHDVYILFF